MSSLFISSCFRVILYSMDNALLNYTKSNVIRVSKIIRSNLTPDLLLKKHRAINEKYPMWGHCHNATGTFYKIFSGQYVQMFRAYDKKTSIKLQYKFYHWWIVDIQTGTNIDLTGEQYQRSHMLELHRIGEKNSMLGLSYEERVNILLKRVLQLL